MNMLLRFKYGKTCAKMQKAKAFEAAASSVVMYM